MSTETNMRTVRLTLGRGEFAQENLYRYSDECYQNGLPKQVLCFVKDPEIRSIVGRWDECRNINVSAQIAKLIEYGN